MVNYDRLFFCSSLASFGVFVQSWEMRSSLPWADRATLFLSFPCHYLFIALRGFGRAFFVHKNVLA